MNTNIKSSMGIQMFCFIKSYCVPSDSVNCKTVYVKCLLRKRLFIE